MKYKEERLRTVRWVKDRIMQTIHHDAVQIGFECTDPECSYESMAECQRCAERCVLNMEKLLKLWRMCNYLPEGYEMDVSMVELVREEQW